MSAIDVLVARLKNVNTCRSQKSSCQKFRADRDKFDKRQAFCLFFECSIEKKKHIKIYLDFQFLLEKYITTRHSRKWCVRGKIGKVKNDTSVC